MVLCTTAGCDDRCNATCGRVQFIYISEGSGHEDSMEIIKKIEDSMR